MHYCEYDYGSVCDRGGLGQLSYSQSNTYLLIIIIVITFIVIAVFNKLICLREVQQVGINYQPVHC